MAFNERLPEILACPQCHGPVQRDEKSGGLICDNCKLLYEVRNGISVMLIEEAKKLPGPVSNTSGGQKRKKGGIRGNTSRKK